MDLEIAIPTYQRPKELANRIRELKPQLSEGMRVVVYENGSTAETKNEIREFLCDEVLYRPSLRNRGACANVMRCIEEGTSEWLWILGDDDPVLRDAIATLRVRCAGNNVFCIATRSFRQPIQGDPKVVSDLTKFFDEISMGEAAFTSGLVWRREFLAGRMEIFVEGSFTQLPHLCCLIDILESGSGNAIIIPETLVNPEASMGSHRWSRKVFMSRCASVLEFCRTGRSRAAVARAMWPTFKWAVGDAAKEEMTDGEFCEVEHSIFNDASRLVRLMTPSHGIFEELFRAWVPPIVQRSILRRLLFR